MGDKRDEARPRRIRGRGKEVGKQMGGEDGEVYAWGERFGRGAEKDAQGSSQ